MFEKYALAAGLGDTGEAEMSSSSGLEESDRSPC